VPAVTPPTPGDSGGGPAGAWIWARVDEIVDASSDVENLRSHGLHLLAARRWRDQGRSLPPELREAEGLATVVALAVPILLQRAMAAYDGPMMVLKGPEVAALYPDPALRPFGDIDLLVEDREKARQAFIGAGFEEAGDATVFGERYHHSRPLFSPGLPVPIELHSRPNWPLYSRPPSACELFARAQPAACMPGLLAPERAQHALVLAAHAWAHAPLSSVGNLVDVAAVSDQLDPRELDALARSWGILRLWRTTRRAMDAVLGSGGSGWAHHLWARNLLSARERTVLEAHVENVVSPLWAAPPGRAMLAAAAAALDELRPAAGEPWRAKLGRSRSAVASALVRKSAHDSKLGAEESRRLRRRLLK
jgi:hypothetical protein